MFHTIRVIRLILTSYFTNRAQEKTTYDELGSTIGDTKADGVVYNN